ncbi:hypothetical protein O6P43_026040 [Quillaja saponaria]|uniref:Uncharacterized protein n=1 Tax=Quillaja saponaria TaxID=32244 RepID=A0AAD7PG99_QUISA|nr:hypothetical protein O6P43_026040 [Quillaja saponaria]
MLHRFGTVIAMPGLILACFAKGDNRTAQRHLGEVLIKAPTLAQQAGRTLTLAFPAAAKHGLRLVAADLMGVLPHSPAASASQIKVFEAIKNISTVTRQAVILNSIIFKCPDRFSSPL